VFPLALLAFSRRVALSWQRMAKIASNALDRPWNIWNISLAVIEQRPGMYNDVQENWTVKSSGTNVQAASCGKSLWHLPIGAHVLTMASLSFRLRARIGMHRNAARSSCTETSRWEC